MVTIKTEQITATVAELGAELKSLTLNGKEYLWQGNPEVWSGSSPLLFPICGGLKDDQYTFNGKTYTMQKHGFARKKIFEVEACSEHSVTLLLQDDAETREQYPFAFELRVIFTTVDSALQVEYRVKNKGEAPMYFSIGAHEGYSTPEGIEDYDVIFPQKETLSATLLDGNLLSDNLLPIIKNSEFLPLYDKYFVIDALVFKNLKSRSATLRNRKTGKAIRVDFPGSDYFLLWHKPAASYICLEPWCGIQDSQHTDGDLTHKEGIIRLDGKQEFSVEHRIQIL